MNLLGDFKLENNAVIGGIAGFVEESVEKEQGPKEDDIPEAPNYDISEEGKKNDGLRLLYNQDPNFALHIVNKFLEHKKVAKANVEFITIMAEIEDEIEKMKEDEENEKYNDS